MRQPGFIAGRPRIGPKKVRKTMRNVYAAVSSTPAIPAAQSHRPPQRDAHAAERIMSLL